MAKIVWSAEKSKVAKQKTMTVGDFAEKQDEKYRKADRFTAKRDEIAGSERGKEIAKAKADGTYSAGGVRAEKQTPQVKHYPTANGYQRKDYSKK